MTERENGRCRLLTDSEEKACASFERMIAAQGEMLFGITLFHDTAPRIVRWIQGRAYRETLNRMNSAIAQANALVSEVRAGKQPYRALDTFSWPPWTSDMQQRIAIMLRAYNIVFPARPKQPLNKAERQLLKSKALDLF